MKKSSTKGSFRIFSNTKPGGCLEPSSDKEDYAYKPAPANQLGTSKEINDPQNIKRKNIFANGKPGGFLDPFYDEDTVSKQLSVKSGEFKSNKRFNFFKKNKPKRDIAQIETEENSDANSGVVITSSRITISAKENKSDIIMTYPADEKLINTKDNIEITGNKIKEANSLKNSIENDNPHVFYTPTHYTLSRTNDELSLKLDVTVTQTEAIEPDIKTHTKQICITKDSSTLLPPVTAVNVNDDKKIKTSPQSLLLPNMFITRISRETMKDQEQNNELPLMTSNNEDENTVINKPTTRALNISNEYIHDEEKYTGNPSLSSLVVDNNFNSANYEDYNIIDRDTKYSNVINIDNIKHDGLPSNPSTLTNNTKNTKLLNNEVIRTSTKHSLPQDSKRSTNIVSKNNSETRTSKPMFKEYNVVDIKQQLKGNESVRSQSLLDNDPIDRRDITSETILPSGFKNETDTDVINELILPEQVNTENINSRIALNSEDYSLTANMKPNKNEENYTDKSRLSSFNKLSNKSVDNSINIKLEWENNSKAGIMFINEKPTSKSEDSLNKSQVNIKERQSVAKTVTPLSKMHRDPDSTNHIDKQLRCDNEDVCNKRSIEMSSAPVKSNNTSKNSYKNSGIMYQSESNFINDYNSVDESLQNQNNEIKTIKNNYSDNDDNNIMNDKIEKNETQINLKQSVSKPFESFQEKRTSTSSQVKSLISNIFKRSRDNSDTLNDQLIGRITKSSGNFSQISGKPSQKIERHESKYVNESNDNDNQLEVKISLEHKQPQVNKQYNEKSQESLGTTNFITNSCSKNDRSISPSIIDSRNLDIDKRSVSNFSMNNSNSMKSNIVSRQDTQSNGTGYQRDEQKSNITRQISERIKSENNIEEYKINEQQKSTEISLLPSRTDETKKSRESYPELNFSSTLINQLSYKDATKLPSKTNSRTYEEYTSRNGSPIKSINLKEEMSEMAKNSYQNKKRLSRTSSQNKEELSTNNDDEYKTDENNQLNQPNGSLDRIRPQAIVSSQKSNANSRESSPETIYAKLNKENKGSRSISPSILLNSINFADTYKKSSSHTNVSKDQIYDSTHTSPTISKNFKREEEPNIDEYFERIEQMSYETSVNNKLINTHEYKINDDAKSGASRDEPRLDSSQQNYEKSHTNSSEVIRTKSLSKEDRSISPSILANNDNSIKRKSSPTKSTNSVKFDIDKPENLNFNSELTKEISSTIRKSPIQSFRDENIDVPFIPYRQDLKEEFYNNTDNKYNDQTDIIPRKHFNNTRQLKNTNVEETIHRKRDSILPKSVPQYKKFVPEKNNYFRTINEDPSIVEGYNTAINNYINAKLITIYETELVPLRNTIRDLREQVDYIVKQQEVFKELLCNVKRTKPIKYNVRRCACVRRKF